MRNIKFLALSALIIVLNSCGGGSEKEFETALESAINHYADIVEANYEDALTDARTLQNAINIFVQDPTPETHQAAKEAWLVSRESYGQSEAFRLYSGPIDDEDGPEGQLNAWPLDESYIDYVTGVTTSTEGSPGSNDASNIINRADLFPIIDKTVIAELNEKDGETNVASGYHAIEFLLWGQDTSPEAGGGERSYTDYLTNGTGTHENQERRGQYVMAAADLIVDDLTGLIGEWTTGGSYRSFFTSAVELNNSLERILSGVGKLSKGELAGERMFVAWDLRDKEDEHSCFSDNTHRDIVSNTVGIRNVYMGSYTRTDGTTLRGTSLNDLLMLKNPELAEELKGLVNQSVSNAEAIQAPFDQEILAEPGRTRIRTSFQSLRKQGDKFAEAAALFGFTLDPSDIG